MSGFGRWHSHVKQFNGIYRLWTDIVGSASTNIGRSTTVMDLFSAHQLAQLSGFPQTRDWYVLPLIQEASH